MSPLLDALVEKGEVFHRSFSNAAKVCFNSASANVTLLGELGKAISGSIIQNSARWRLVFEFSARKRPKITRLGIRDGAGDDRSPAHRRDGAVNVVSRI